jgi:hypothetical protein
MATQGAQGQYDDVISSDQLDIDGLYGEPQDFSKARQNIEKATNNMVDKKIENVRVKHEKALQKDLANIFGSDTDSIGTQSAAVHKVEAPLEQGPSNSMAGRFRLTPYIGGSLISTDYSEISTNFATGVRLDATLNKRFAIGAAINYSQAEITSQNDNAFVVGPNGYRPSFNGFIRPLSEIDYSRFSVDFTSKVFILNDEMVRPYVSLGLGFARNSLEFADRVNQNVGAYQPAYSYLYDQQQYSDIQMTGSLGLGADMMFSEQIGLNIDFNYQMGLGGNDKLRGNPYNSQYFQSPQFTFLESIGNELRDASVMGLSAGLIVQF